MNTHLSSWGWLGCRRMLSIPELLSQAFCLSWHTAETTWLPAWPKWVTNWLGSPLCSHWKAGVSCWLFLLTKQPKTQLHHPLALPTDALVLLPMDWAAQLVMTPPGSKLNGSSVISCRRWRGHREPDLLLLAHSTQPLQANNSGKSVRTFPRQRADALLQVWKVFPSDEQEDLFQWYNCPLPDTIPGLRGTRSQHLPARVVPTKFGCRAAPTNHQTACGCAFGFLGPSEQEVWTAINLWLWSHSSLYKQVHMPRTCSSPSRLQKIGLEVPWSQRCSYPESEVY